MTRVGRAVDGARVGGFRIMMRVDSVGRGSSYRLGVMYRLIEFLEDGVAPIVNSGAYTKRPRERGLSFCERSSVRTCRVSLLPWLSCGWSR